MDVKNIPTFNPKGFQNLIKAKHEPWKRKGFDHFFIHKLLGYEHRIKLPLAPHRKTVHDLLYITNGSVNKAVDIDRYAVKKGSVFIVSSGRIRSIENISANVDGFYCHFSDSFIAEAAHNFDTLSFFDAIQSPHVTIPDSTQDVISTLIGRMNDIFYSTNNTDIIQSYLITLLKELQQLITTNQKKSISAATYLTLRFKQLASLNIKERYSVEAYANMLHVSPNHLNKTVKQTTGVTASTIINELLILEGKVLLGKPSILISEVAYQLGFDDPSYFGRFFRKHTGKTPTEYRNMIDLSD